MNKQKKQIKLLCERFSKGISEFKSENYNEAQLRNDFIDPFLEILGWDINNIQGKNTNEREVLVEESLKSEELDSIKKPDYTFRLHAERKFFLEAKKPFIKIESDKRAAHQIRSYGYSSALKISILSNFEYLLIYDTSIRPNAEDNAQTCLIKSFHYTEFEDKFGEIQELIGFNSVYEGKFDEIWKDISIRKEHIPVDKVFLDQINEWRLILAKEIKEKDSSKSLNNIDDIVQSYINKLLFIRVCEDRNIEKYKELFDIANTESIKKLIELFKSLDLKYNSGLFEELLTPRLIEDLSSTFWKIVRELYYPQSPYSFNVFSSEILGGIYESFLSKRLGITNGEVSLINKPENIDKDIVTTPQYIIREILRETILCKIANISYDQLLNLKFCDISCGSGAFLLELFQLLCDTMVDYFIKHDISELIPIGVKSYRLPFDKKLQILKNCIYGVDKDYNSVEATKFGLLLKVLEDENINSLPNLRPLLPDLNDNIYFGNSLLDFEITPEKYKQEINPFDFPEFKFDAIIGNPPYQDSEFMKNLTPIEHSLYPKKYFSAYKQYDKYFLFIERALSLLKSDGMLGYIVPSKFMKVGSGLHIRELLTKNKYLSQLISFGANQVFEGKTNYTCLLILNKSSSDTFIYEEVSDLQSWKNKLCKREYSVRPANFITSNTWSLFPKKYDSIFDKIHSNYPTLENVVGKFNIFNGIQTSANDIFILHPFAETKNTVKFLKNGKEWEIEKEITKPYFLTERESNDICSSFRTFNSNAKVIFPYKNNHHNKLDIIQLKYLSLHYPLAYNYLIANKIRLKKRDIKPTPKKGNEWYRYGRHQNLEACELKQKIIVGVLSQGEKYAVDTHGVLISSGGTAGYCIIAIPAHFKYSIYYLQALLSSRPMEWVCSLYGEIFRGGFIARGTKVLKQLPFRKINFDDPDDKKLHDKLVALQIELIKLGDRIAEAKNDRRILIPLKRLFLHKKKSQEEIIKIIFNLSDEEYSIIPQISSLYKK